MEISCTVRFLLYFICIKKLCFPKCSYYIKISIESICLLLILIRQLITLYEDSQRSIRHTIIDIDLL